MEKPKIRLDEKGSKVRTIPLHPQAIDLLQRILGDEGIPPPDGGDKWNEKVFPLDDNQLATMSRTLKNCAEALGLETNIPHSLKHYFGSWCAMSGVHERVIADWLGHQDVDLVRRVYGHLMPRYHDEQMSKVQL